MACVIKSSIRTQLSPRQSARPVKVGGVEGLRRNVLADFTAHSYLSAARVAHRLALGPQPIETFTRETHCTLLAFAFVFCSNIYLVPDSISKRVHH